LVCYCLSVSDHSYYPTEAKNASLLDEIRIRQGSNIIDAGLWNYNLIDPNTAISGSFYMPIGQWNHCWSKERCSSNSEGEVHENLVSRFKGIEGLMSRSMGDIGDAYRPSLLKCGLPPDVVQMLSSNVKQGVYITSDNYLDMHD